MVRTTVLKVGDHAVEGVPINIAKEEKMVPEPPMNSGQRRKLGDITNFQNQKQVMNQGVKQQQQAILVSYKENAEKLQKENMRLMKVLMERNEIIKLNGSELQKLRIGLHKVQEQNLLLAQANTRILAELNTSKDQLKVYQHELSCKNGLLMARKIQLEAQNLPCTCYHASKDKALANACGGACKTFQSNGADHKNASEGSNVDSLQIKEKANNKSGVSGRKNPTNSEVLYNIGRPGETRQMEDTIGNKKLVCDGDNAADKKELVLDTENHINDNVQSKRFCAGRQSASLETDQAENLQKVDDAKEIKEKARFSLRKRSARLKSQELESSENFHESIETTKSRRVSLRRQSAMFNFQELGVTENLNGVHDDQDIATNAGCSASEQSIESKPNAVEPDDTKEITEKSRVSSRRQSTKVKSQRAIKESAEPPLRDDIVEEASQIPSSSVSMELKRESRSNEAEEMRKTSVGRPVRQAAGKIKSYKEVSLKEKMRRSF